MSNIADARNATIKNQTLNGLPQTLITVTAGQIWRLYWASLSLSIETTNAFVPPFVTFDVWMEISGGDTLLSVSEITTAAVIHSALSASMDLGGRAIAGGTVVRLNSNGLPVNTIARCNGSLLYGTS